LTALGLSKQAWYYQANEIDDGTVKEQIETVLIESPYYGYRRVTAELKNQGIIYNHKRILRIMGEYHLIQAPKKRAKPRTTNSNHSLLVYPNAIADKVAIVPGHIWVADVTYVWIGNRWAYVAIVLDQGTRKVVGWSIGTSLHRQLCLDALSMALKTHTAPLYHHSDRGVQYCSHDYIKLLKDSDIIPSMAAVGVSVDNPFAESFNRSLKVEEVYLNVYESLEEATASIGAYITCYNTKRLHSSLGYQTPVQFEAQLLS
jgi:putative transposase